MQCDPVTALDRCDCPPCPTWVVVPFPAAHVSDAPRGLFAARDGRVFLTDPGIFYSDTLDGTWLAATAGEDDPHLDVRQDLDGGLLLGSGVISGSATLFESSDSGASWTSVTIEPSSPSSTGALSPGGLYAVSNVGLFFRPAGQSAWTQAGWSSSVVANAHGDVMTDIARFRPSLGRWEDLREVLGTLESEGKPILATDQGAIYHDTATGLWVSGDLGETYEQIWFERFDALSSNASGVVALIEESLGVFVRREDGWAQIGPDASTNSADFDAVAVLPDGRVAAIWQPSGGRAELVVTAEPVPNAAPYPTTGFAAPACRDGERSGSEEEVDCGGDCATCATWNLVPWAPATTTFFLAPEGVLFAGDLQGWTFRSTDDGKTWQTCAIPAELTAAGGLRPELGVAPDGTVYRIFDTVDGLELLRSVDAGVTFTHVGPAPENGVFVFTNDAMYVDVGGDGYRSTDGGATWEPIEIPGASSAMFGLGSGTLFANSETGVWF
ncbi:MAG TPA: hypothetical protein VGK73_38400, partial [Polyangiaceae bacterium]